jgi:hypothetical protein
MTPVTEIVVSALIAICSVHTCYFSEDGPYMQIDAAPGLAHPDDTLRFYHGDEVIVIVPKGMSI